MRIYTAHVRPSATAPDRDLKLIPEGFCWPAAIVPVFWALWHRMWIVAALLVAVSFAASAALQALAIGQGLMVLFSAAAALVLGLTGHDLRRWSLARAGCDEVAVVGASDPDSAAQRLMDEQPELFANRRIVDSQPGTALGGWNSAWPDPFGPRLGRDRDNAGWRPAPGGGGT